MARQFINPNIDPTNPKGHLAVKGITQPAQPQAVVADPAAVPPPVATATAAPSGGMAPPAYDPSLYAPVADPEPENADVAPIVADVMSKNTPLMKQARHAGMAAGNERGLLNSSIAIGAAEDSAYRVALPIASQTAAQIHQRNQQKMDIAAQLNRMRAQAGFEAIGRYETYKYTYNLNQNQYDFQRQQLANQQAFERQMAAIQNGYNVDMANLQATLQSKLQAQGHEEQMLRMQSEFEQQTKMQAANAQAALDQIKAQGDVQLTLQANQFEQALKELTLQLNNQNAQAAAAAAVNLFNAEAQLRAALLSNPNMPAAERAKYESLISQLSGPTRDYVNSVLGYTGTGTAPLPGTTPTPTPAPAPAPAPAPSGGMAPPAASSGGSSGGGSSFVDQIYNVVSS